MKKLIISCAINMTSVALLCIGLITGLIPDIEGLIPAFVFLCSLIHMLIYRLTLTETVIAQALTFIAYPVAYLAIMSSLNV